MPICTKCQQRQTRGLYFNDDGEPLCSRCVPPKARQKRVKLMCSCCEDIEVFSEVSEGSEPVCWRCKPKVENRKNANCCSECKRKLKRVTDFTTKCSGCFGDKAYRNKIQNLRRAGLI